MAKVRNNIMVRGLSGAVGEQFVIRKDKAGRTIISNIPTFDEKRQFSEAQLAQQEAFREASAYAQTAKDQEVYVAKADGTPMHPRNVAMADWLHEPQIKDIDLSGWNGLAGQMIRIQAVDDVQVKQVTVVITDETGTVLEQGAAVKGDIMGTPQINTIDLSKYQGVVGNTIRVLAEDSVGISRLTLSVYDTTASQVIESGEKVFTSQIASTVEWEYTATVAVAADHAIEVRVAAYDLSGNQFETSKTK